MHGRKQERAAGTASLRAGDQARDFTLIADDGRAVSLAAELAKGPVVLSFLDSRHPGDTDSELAALSGCVAEIRAHGAALLAISSAVRPNTETPPDFPVRDFPVLFDAGRVVAAHYGISAPASFVIDRASMIVLSLIDAVPGSSLGCANIVSALSALRRIEDRRQHSKAE